MRPRRLVVGNCQTSVKQSTTTMIGAWEASPAMTTVLTPTTKQLRARRAKLLADLGLSEEDLRERAKRHELTRAEYYALESLDEIDYLLGAEPAVR